MKIQVPPPTDVTASPTSRRIVLSLFRNILRWCRETDRTIPLTTFVPPIYLQAPSEVEPYHLEMLATQTAAATTSGWNDPVQFARRHMPRSTQYQVNSMVVPTHTPQSLEGFFRSIFRMNAYLPSEEAYQKKRIDNAFDALKSLNQLSSSKLLDLQQTQQRNRNGVLYNVGQVIQHKERRFRGVIAGWDIREVSDATSLTNKEYGDTTNSGTFVVYRVIVDLGDAHQLGHPREQEMNGDGFFELRQSDVELVQNPLLMRIRNDMVNEHFDGFRDNSFIPSPLMSYQYPEDLTVSDSRVEINDAKVDRVADELVRNVQSLATELSHLCESEEAMSELNIQLQSIKDGRIMVPLLLQSRQVSSIARAAHHVQELLGAIEEWKDAHLFRRQRHQIEKVHDIQFKVGEVIRHRVFGYRGVVVGWDPRPVVDVSAWNGVQHLKEENKDPNELPFYHVIRHFEEDTVETPPMRYVCQENLEISMSREDLSSSLDFQQPGWTWDGDGYIPPARIRFKYGNVDSSLEECVKSMLEKLNESQLSDSDSFWTEDDKKPETNGISIESLEQLQGACTTLTEASIVQEAIREVRQANDNIELRWKLASGVEKTLSGDMEEALQIFREIIAEDPDYAEAWNKRATCEFVLGLYDEAKESSETVLELDPGHLPALNGLGLIFFQRKDWEAAAQCFQRSIEADPWSPVSSKLSLCLEMIEKDHS